MIDDPLHRFSAFVDLTDGERTALHDTIGHESAFDAAQRFALEGDQTTGLFFLHEGWALSSITHADAGCQVLKVHRSGDLMGMPSMPLETMVESLIAPTPARVSMIPLPKLGALLSGFPRLGALLLAAQEERVTLMDRLAVGGQLGVKHSVAALLLLMFNGRPPSDDSDTRLHIPMSQPQISDVLGLSAVHVNRVMVALETDGLIKRDGPSWRTDELPDAPRLRALVGLPERVRRRDPAWLPSRRRGHGSREVRTGLTSITPPPRLGAWPGERVGCAAVLARDAGV